MFSVVVLVAVLGALSYETVEDNFVNLVYARMFGWRTLLIAFVIAGAIVAPLSVALVVVAPTLFRSYFLWVQKAGALVLLAVGIGWLAFSLLGKGDEPEDRSEAREREKQSRKSLGLATQLVIVEQVEIVAILIPLGITGHAFEAVIAGVIAVSVALAVAVTLRRWFAKFVKGRFRVLKVVSGVALVVLGVVLLIN